MNAKALVILATVLIVGGILWFFLFSGIGQPVQDTEANTRAPTAEIQPSTPSTGEEAPAPSPQSGMPILTI